jgi:segregation and condensation protein B
MDIEELQPILEAIIYAADDPVRPEQLKEVFPAESYDKIETALQALAQEFNARRGGMWIREIAGGFRKTKPGAKLSLAALETLAVIAYKQPVTLAEILAIRGKKSTTALHTLLERKLVVIIGRKAVVGRPILYGTSKEFLVHFGLKDLTELPTLEEFAQMAGEIS